MGALARRLRCRAVCTAELGGGMWFANNSAKLVTSILVIVLLGAAFAFV